mgnify:CR=1 FL=1
MYGKVMLFDRSRHSDHHSLAKHKYQVQGHQDKSPSLPTGHPGMVSQPFIPRLWIRVMNKRILPLQKKAERNARVLQKFTIVKNGACRKIAVFRL